MAFIDDYKIVKAASSSKAKKQDKDLARSKGLPLTQEEFLMDEILIRCGLKNDTAEDQYKNLDQILAARNTISSDIKKAGLKEDVSVVGGVTELICKIALDASIPKRYERLPKQWKWVGDFAIVGIPFNLYISVKSYTAKERLIASGTGQGAAPIIGYGLFEKPEEWSPSRVNQYRHRGFVAIYMPEKLYNELDAKTGKEHPATKIVNIYDKPLLRKTENFASDLKRVIKPSDFIIELEKF